jgi:hypothetical protein
MQFLLAEFIEENGDRSVAVVPVIWVNDGVCSWLPYKKERLNRAVLKSEVPGVEWEACDCRVLYKASKHGLFFDRFCLAKYFAIAMHILTVANSLKFI